MMMGFISAAGIQPRLGESREAAVTSRYPHAGGATTRQVMKSTMKSLSIGARARCSIAATCNEIIDVISCINPSLLISTMSRLEPSRLFLSSFAHRDRYYLLPPQLSHVLQYQPAEYVLHLE